MKIKYLKITFSLKLLFLIITNYTMAQTIAAGGWHSLVICNDGTVKTFGENDTGQLGNGTNVDSNTPITPGLSNCAAVSGGGDQLEAHSMALKDDGSVWSWGSNLYGGLGNGSTTSISTPAQVTSISNVSAISAGGWHSTALKNDGTVWTWGWNADGQLGDGTLVDKLIPTQISGLNGVTSIKAGTYHVLVLKSDGTVWAWGDNEYGQIGNGTTITDQTTPVQVLSGVTKIAAGRFFSMALKSDGTVWTWGQNLYGQLGNGTTTDSPSPIQVSGINNVIDITCGAFECHVIKSDETAWAWGRNTYGNLGDGTAANSSTPVQSVGLTNVVRIAAGTNFALFAKSDGTFWGCGRNLSGQLGDGTFTQRNSPFQSTIMCPILFLGVENQSQNIHTKTYPNPSNSGIFNVELNRINPLDNNATIQVYNSIGAIVYQLNPTNNLIQIDLSNEANGLYILSVSNGNETIYQKLIKQ
ncbi:MAG TPA: T9SS type A sorting domain-containing protein [Bacteroidia bacterium]|nr:T9SS type A sorting domain-containing protein [Bacteroidia bacterium]